MLAFLSGTFKGLSAARALIRRGQTQVVLGMGGFTSLAPILAGKKEKCRTLIHDSNAVPDEYLDAALVDMQKGSVSAGGQFGLTEGLALRAELQHIPQDQHLLSAGRGEVGEDLGRHDLCCDVDRQRLGAGEQRLLVVCHHGPREERDTAASLRESPHVEVSRLSDRTNR